MAHQGIGLAHSFTVAATPVTWLKEVFSSEVTGISVTEIQTSHFETQGGYHTYMAEDLADSGSATVEFIFDESEELGVPGTTGTYRITKTDGSNYVEWAAYIADVGWSVAMGERQEATVTFRLSGPPTYSP